MAFINPNTMVDARRFDRVAHATVLPSGRLRFAADAADMMNLDAVKGILLFDTGVDVDGRKTFGAVACTVDDARAFSVKSSGPYKYISLKEFFIQQEIDFKSFSISYEVTSVDEEFEGYSVFRLTQYQVRRSQDINDYSESKERLMQLEGRSPKTKSDEEIIAEKDRIVQQEIERAKNRS